MISRSESIQNVGEAPDASFTELVAMTSLVPETDFQFSVLSETDFRGCSLRGFNFTGSRLQGSKFEGTFISGATFDAVQWTLPELQLAADYDEARAAWLKIRSLETRTITDPEWLSIWRRDTLPDWVDGYGSDSYGRWASITIKGVPAVMRYCPSGRYLMGSDDGEPGRWPDERPEVAITFADGFWLFDTVVSQSLYEAVMGENPSRNIGSSFPAELVNWEDAHVFLGRINEAMPGLNCRLPSESEWEYACRAGSSTPFCPDVAVTHAGHSITSKEVNHDGGVPFGNAKAGDFFGKTVFVKGGSYHPNSWGLWHMHGNLWEWCEDVWSETHDGADPTGLPRRGPDLSAEKGRVVRGGCWIGDARDCRSACRSRYELGQRTVYIGFRIAVG